jgi:phosphotransferase system enzyme I (PtsI)
MPDAISPTSEVRYKGTAASPGVAIGPLVIIQRDEHIIRRRKIRPEDVPHEIERLENALLETRKQIQAIKEKLSDSLGEKDAGIFDAHLLVVEDHTFLGAVKKEIEKKLLTVEYIYQSLTKAYAQKMLEMDDAYLSERANDILDVSRRVLRNLEGLKDLQHQIDVPSLIFAHDLTPSDTVSLDRKLVLGFVTEVGNRTSHTAIMARSLNLPAVVGVREVVMDDLEPGVEVLIDGHDGLFILNPSEQTKYEYGQIESRRHAVEESLDQLRETSAVTRDGRKVIVSANVELPDDLPHVAENGAEGIGLYRTEFLFLNRLDFPSEQEQAEMYRRVAQGAKPGSVIVRTLDVGGDKVLSHTGIEPEMNPFLGWRGIRFCLDKVDMFKTQLRAICRASAEGNVRVMFPMITEVQEVRRARTLLNEVMADLRKENVPMAEKIECGLMIEVPSAAMTADILAKEVDFFSIGTNDLIQYTLAVDRVNEKVANLYQPTHPAVLRLIRRTVEAAHANNIWVGICGEMAGDIILTPLLVGLGIDELSLGSISVPRIKRVIQSLHYQESQQLAESLMNRATGQEIWSVLEEQAQRLYPELL